MRSSIYIYIYIYHFVTLNMYIDRGKDRWKGRYIQPIFKQINFHSIFKMACFDCLTRCVYLSSKYPLRWRHNGCDSVSNHQPRHCLLNRLFRRRSKKTSKLRVTGLCAGNSPGTGEFSAHMASNAENVSIWWRHHARNASLHGWYIGKPQCE